MEFLNLLQGTQSKTKVLKAISYIGSNPAKFGRYIDEFKNSTGREAQKLAWILGTIVDSQPQLIPKHIPTLLSILQHPCHAAVKRNILRAIEKVSIKKGDLGLAADLTFRFLEDINETVAVKAFSMSILLKICQLEPELSPELISILEYQMPYASPGFRARAKKIINSLTE